MHAGQPRGSSPQVGGQQVPCYQVQPSNR
jgi:hypothetical protein